MQFSFPLLFPRLTDHILFTLSKNTGIYLNRKRIFYVYKSFIFAFAQPGNLKVAVLDNYVEFCIFPFDFDSFLINFQSQDLEPQEPSLQEQH